MGDAYLILTGAPAHVIDIDIEYDSLKQTGNPNVEICKKISENLVHAKNSNYQVCCASGRKTTSMEETVKMGLSY